MGAVAYLLRPEYLPFAVAFALVAMLGVLEAVGMGLSLLCDSLGLEFYGEVDYDGAPETTVMGLLGFGRVPLGVMLVCWLFLFGVSGVILQRHALHYYGSELSAWTAGLYALLPAAVLNSVVVRILGRLMPRDESYSVTVESLLNREGLMQGTATQGKPARAVVRDSYGQPHYVMAEPVGECELGAGQRIVLKKLQGHNFTAAPLSTEVTD